MARLLRGDRDRLLDGRRLVRRATRRRCSSATTRRAAGTTSSRRRSSSRWLAINIVGPRSSSTRAVADRGRPARRLRRLHRRHARRHRPRPARVQRLSAGLGHRRERRADLLRLPRLQRDHVRRRRPARSGARAAEGDVPRARRHDGHLRPDRDRRLRHADRRPRSSRYGETAIAEAARPRSATPASR